MSDFSDDSLTDDDDDLDENTCVICYAHRKNATLAPCTHRFCVDCVVQVRNRQCPICSSRIEFYRVDGEAEPRHALYEGAGIADAEVEGLRDDMRGGRNERKPVSFADVCPGICAILCIVVFIVVVVAIGK